MTGPIRWAVALALIASGSAAGSARAQGPAWGDGGRLDAFAGGARLGAPSWFGGGSSSYLPAGGFGAFIPYTSGPGQGLGVLPRGPMSGPRGPAVGMGMPGAGPDLGQPSGSLRPLTPIGSSGGAGMGQGGSLAAPGRAGMRLMPRPPVGSYPFRIPPSVLGPGGPAPGMSM